MQRLTDSTTSRGTRAGVTLLLVLFLLPMLSVWFSSSPSTEASRPVCCRLHGKHHCSMDGMGVGGSSDGERSSISRTRVSERCPYQGATAASHLADPFGVIPDASFGVTFQENLAGVSRLCLAVCFRTFRAHPKRGPPSSSDSSHEA